MGILLATCLASSNPHPINLPHPYLLPLQKELVSKMEAAASIHNMEMEAAASTAHSMAVDSNQTKIKKFKQDIEEDVSSCSVGAALMTVRALTTIAVTERILTDNEKELLKAQAEVQAMKAQLRECQAAGEAMRSRAELAEDMVGHLMHQVAALSPPSDNMGTTACAQLLPMLRGLDSL